MCNFTLDFAFSEGILSFSMKKLLYPLKFAPLYRRPAWGSTLLAETFERGLPTNELIGESVELIDHDDAQSVVANGALAGRTLRDLVATMPTELVGSRQQASQPFPLHVKYLATGQRLPLFVHPDELASGTLTPAVANSKMWYIVASRPAVTVLAGIKPRYTQQQFLTALNSPELTEILQNFPSEPGDAYYLAAGRVHALESGNLVLSIEQRSADPQPVSYWGAAGSTPITGTALKETLDSIHFQDRTIARIRCESSTVQRNRKLPLVNLCPHFWIDELRLIQAMHERTDGSTFHYIAALDGPVELTWGGETMTLARGECSLVPAALGYYSIVPCGRLTKVIKATLRT